MTEKIEYVLEQVERDEKNDKQNEEFNREIDKTFENNNCFDINDEHCSDISCEECKNYMTRNCVLTDNNSSGDDWANEDEEMGVNNIDNALEGKRHK